MISIALVVVLILGVNQVFTYTTQAVGAGEAINAAIRDSRAIGSSLDYDFAAIVPPGGGPNDSASLIISSSQIYAFRDKADRAADRDGDPRTRDLNNNKIEGEINVLGEQIRPWTYNYRNHRLDVLSFFARDLYSRQTGNYGNYADNMSSQEAWVWYGHLWLPDNTGNYFYNDPVSSKPTPTFPGFGTPLLNPNNLYATQFVLGRMAVLLREKSADVAPPTSYIADNAGYYQRFVDRTAVYPTGATLATDIEPLCGSAMSSTLPGDNAQFLLQDSRFDLAATSISAYKNKLQSYISNTTANANLPAWWDQMMDGNPNTTNPSGIAVSIPPKAGESVSTRFKCNPFAPKPLDAVGLAQASPYCLGGCSQFMVEYAGDYLIQDNDPAHLSTYGVQQTNPSNPTSYYGQDGQIDYVLIPPSPMPVPPVPRSQWRKQIVWYGMPRSTSTSPNINGYKGDVVPLSFYLNAAASFEKILPFNPAQGAASMKEGAQYICAWGPTDVKPKLIRITLTVDDPTGRLPEGQTFQYVFNVP